MIRLLLIVLLVGSIRADPTCQLKGNDTVVMPNFALNISEPYEVMTSVTVDARVGDQRILEKMAYQEWGNGSLVDVECRNYFGGCLRRWMFDNKGLTLLDNNTSCQWYDRMNNLSINVLVGGQPTVGGAVIRGYKDLLANFSALNATRETINVTTDIPYFDSGVNSLSLYKLCFPLNSLNTTAMVELYVVESIDDVSKNSMMDVGKPSIIRMILSNIDYGLFSNSSKNGKTANVTMTFRMVYNKPPFLRGNRSSTDMVIPLNVYCPYPILNTSKLPLPTDNIHVMIEEAVDADQSVVIREERINFKNKLARRSFIIPSDDSAKNKLIFQLRNAWMTGYTSDFKSNVNTAVHTIHDYTYGVEWAVAPSTDQCLMRQIPTNAPEAIVVSAQNATVNMSTNLYQLLDINATNYSCYGNSTYRSLPVNVWGAKKTDYPAKGQYSVVKLFFLSAGWQFDVDISSKRDSPLIGMQVFVYNATTNASIGNYKANIVDMEVESPSTFWKMHDFHACLSGANSLNSNLSTYVLSFNETSVCQALSSGDVSESVIEAAIIDALSRAANNMSILRIGDVFPVCTSAASVDVSFRILDRFNASMLRGNVVGGQLIANISEIVAALNRTVNNGTLKVAITTSAQKNYSMTAIKQTLRLANQTTVINVQPAPAPSPIITGHTAGAMAGLAFAMLIIGAVIAVVGVYLYQRRRNAQFSYMVQE